MDIPIEELKQPLVTRSANETTASSSFSAPMSSSSSSSSAPSTSPLRDQNQRRPMNVTSSSGGNGHGNNGGAGFSHSRSATDLEQEEQKEQETMLQNDKRQLPYAAPNVHPYAVPDYSANAFSNSSMMGGNGQWGYEESSTNTQSPHGVSVDVMFSGLYTLAAALTILQGFAMMVDFRLSSIFLGLYTMAFGAAAVLFDLKAVVYGISVEAYFPFLGNYLGRGLTVLFFAVICAQVYEYAGWTKLVVLLNVLVAVLQGFVFFTTQTVNSHAPHMEAIPDL